MKTNRLMMIIYCKYYLLVDQQCNSLNIFNADLASLRSLS